METALENQEMETAQTPKAETERALSGKELMRLKAIDGLREKGLGDILDEMIQIGDRSSVYVKRNRHKVERSEMLRDELNRRWSELEGFAEETDQIDEGTGGQEGENPLGQ